MMLRNAGWLPKLSIEVERVYRTILPEHMDIIVQKQPCHRSKICFSDFVDSYLARMQSGRLLEPAYATGLQLQF